MTPPDGESDTGAEVGTSTVGRDAARSFGWAVVGFAGSRLALFVATIVVARILAPEAFGVVAAAVTVLTFVEIGLDLGLGSAVVAGTDGDPHGSRVRTATTLSFAAAVSLGLGLVVLAPAMADVLQVPGESAVFRIVGAVVVLRGMTQIADALCRRELRFRFLTAVELVRAALRLAVSVALALAGAGAVCIPWGMVAGEAAGLVLFVAGVHGWPAFGFRRRDARALLGFGGSVFAMRLLVTLGVNVDYLVVGVRLGPEALGLYYVGYRLPELLIQNVYLVFYRVSLPAYARAARHGLTELARTVLRATTLVTLFGFTVGVGLALTSEEVIGVLFGPVWAAAAGPMLFVSLAIGVDAFGFGVGEAFPALGRPARALPLYLVGTPLQVVALSLAAGAGIVAVAATQMVVAVLYVVGFGVLAGATLHVRVGRWLRAVRPGLVASAGVLVAVVPLLVWGPGGPVGLTAQVLAGAAGATLALVLASRDTFGLLADTLRALTPSGAGRRR